MVSYRIARLSSPVSDFAILDSYHAANPTMSLQGLSKRAQLDRIFLKPDVPKTLWL